MRPFRNPETQAQIDANRLYKIEQLNLPPDQREAQIAGDADPEWRWTPAWRIDRAESAVDRNGELHDYFDIVDPFVEARLRIRRDPEEERMAANDRLLKMYKRMDLSKLKEGPAMERDITLPPFKVEYDSHEQIHQKLNNTVILIKNNPFYVTQTCEYSKGKFALAVTDPTGDTTSLVHYDDVIDCRGIAPAYYNHRGRAWWIYRVPERQNAQGMNQRNMQYKPAGGAASAIRTNELLQALANARDIPWRPNLSDLLLSGANDSLRLSSRIALYKSGKKGAPIGVEYCGRHIGLIINDACKVSDETDLIPSWISKDFARIELNLVA